MRPSSVPSPPLIPPSPILSVRVGDEETDHSYDSSQLRPSPSMMSVSIPQLHSRRSQVAPPYRPTSFPRRLASPALRYSESSSSPALQLSSSSSSVTSSSVKAMPSFSSLFSNSVISPPQPSLSSSSMELLPLPAEPRVNGQSVVGRTPRTISTLLDTAHASASHSPTPIPIPPPRTYTVVPEGTIAMTLSTPYGSGGNEQEAPSLRTVSEKPLPPTPRNFALEIDILAEDLRGYNNARGQESKEIVDDVKALREELQGLSEYSRSTRPLLDVVRIVERPIAPSPRPILESRSVGSSTEITASSPEVPESVGAALTRASSVTSVGSFLSSHHSDDLSLYAYAASESPASPLSDTETEFEDDSGFVSSSEVTESEVMPPATPARIMPLISGIEAEFEDESSFVVSSSEVTKSEITPPEIMPTPSARSSSQPTRIAHSGAPLVSIDLLAQQFNAIRDQLDYLANNQAATVRKMDSLCAPEYPEIPAMHDKIDRVEGLVRGLVQRFDSQPPQPVMVAVPIHQPTLVRPEPRPPSQAATIHDQLPYRTPTA